MLPSWQKPHNGTLFTEHDRKAIIREAYRLRLIVKRRADTEAEKAFMHAKHSVERHELIYRLSLEQLRDDREDSLTREAIDQALQFSIKPNRSRLILIEMNGEIWASARWLHTHLEASVCFDSLTIWLTRYRCMIRRKLNVDGHLWLYHVADFKEWRKKSLTLRVRGTRLAAKMMEKGEPA